MPIVSRGFADVDEKLQPIEAPLVFLPCHLAFLSDPRNGKEARAVFDQILDVDGRGTIFKTLKQPEIERLRRKSELTASMMFAAILRNGANAEVQDGNKKDLADLVGTSKIMSYWLNRALDKRIYLPRVKEFYSKINAPQFGQIFFSLVGQEIAVDWLCKKVQSKLANEPGKLFKKPLVAFLAGPPGAGKSQLSETIANAIAPGNWHRDIFSSVDPGMANAHLFGAEAGYIGSDRDPGTAHFCRSPTVENVQWSS